MYYNLLDIAEPPQNFAGKKVMIPLSAGINSATVLCVVGENHPEELKPEELHLYYDHFREHSPDSFKFVADCIRYARRRFKRVVVKINKRSVLQFFEEKNMIPHPIHSPCSRILKIEPRIAYEKEYGIDFVMVGFVRSEMKRVKRQQKFRDTSEKLYPILNLTDENCFSIVKSAIGWYPAIYDIKENGKRVFTHNNCLPCKNMSAKQFANVGKYFPEYAQRAQHTAEIVGDYWGRDDVPDIFKCDVCERM